MPNLELQACASNITKYLPILEMAWCRIIQWEMQPMLLKVFTFFLIFLCITSHTHPGVCIFDQKLQEIETETPEELKYTTEEVVKPLNLEEARRECAKIPLMLVPSLALLPFMLYPSPWLHHIGTRILSLPTKQVWKLSWFVYAEHWPPRYCIYSTVSSRLVLKIYH